LVIGTAKPSQDELQRIPHHFINSLSIHDDYDAAQYGHDALKLISLLFEKYSIVILCGGSGLYIKAVTDGFDEIPEVPEDITLRVMKGYEEHGIVWLQKNYVELEPSHYEEIDHQNPHRLMRALAVRLATGRAITRFQMKKKMIHPFSVLKIGLELPRNVLYERIDTRMDDMVSNGLFEEAKELYPFRDRQALQTVGYQEIFDYFDGACDKEETLRLLKRNSRRYAKRQLTWFKKDNEIQWYSPSQIGDIISTVQQHQSSLQHAGIQHE
jgi:tRNA dimethylallyltransferase